MKAQELPILERLRELVFYLHDNLKLFYEYYCGTPLIILRRFCEEKSAANIIDIKRNTLVMQNTMILFTDWDVQKT